MGLFEIVKKELEGWVRNFTAEQFLTFVQNGKTVYGRAIRIILPGSPPKQIALNAFTMDERKLEEYVVLIGRAPYIAKLGALDRLYEAVKEMQNTECHLSQAVTNELVVLDDLQKQAEGLSLKIEPAVAS